MNQIQQRIADLWNDKKYYTAGIVLKKYLNHHSKIGFQATLAKFGMTSRENVMTELTADIDRLKQAQRSNEDLSTSLLDPLSDMDLDSAYQRLHKLNHSDYPIYQINGQSHKYNGRPAKEEEILRLVD